jgi:hypothetical protein
MDVIDIIEGMFLPVAWIKGMILLTASLALFPIMIKSFVLNKGYFLMKS